MNGTEREAARRRMMELVYRHTPLNRTAVNADTDKLVETIRQRLDCTVRTYPAAEEVLTWQVPRHWQVRDARLVHEDGTVIAEYAETPLRVWTHSVPFQGILTKEELEPHLHYDPKRPEQIPYHYINGYRYIEQPSEWGFCLSFNEYKDMPAGRYHVVIDADLDHDGTMKVVDLYLEGEREETIFFAAHTCHPGQAADGLTDVAVLVALFERLKRQEKRRYSYRLILGPEYFAAAGLLSDISQREINNLIGGVYADFIGNRQPFALSVSRQGDALIDRTLLKVMKHKLSEYSVVGHRALACNDEMFYNGPGFDIPTVYFGGLVYPQYHSEQDDADFVDYDQMLEALELLEKAVEVLETDFVPIRKFRGPLYLSRFGLYVTPQEDKYRHDVQERTQIMMDGRRSCLDIAYELDADFFAVRDFCIELEQHDLIERSDEAGFGC
jgi:aminopeptidase-like protein